MHICYVQLSGYNVRKWKIVVGIHNNTCVCVRKRSTDIEIERLISFIKLF